MLPDLRIVRSGLRCRSARIGYALVGCKRGALDIGEACFESECD